MNVDRLLQLYEKVADTPEAVPRLRQFVLDLAVRGKLIPQDPSDEPASELLKRIVAVNARLKVKHSSTPVAGEEFPFPLPKGWTWSRIGDLCSKTGSGSTPRGGKEVYKTTGVPFLRSQNVYDDGLRLADVAYIDEEVHERMAGTKVVAADLLLNITGGSIGRCCRVPDDFGEANISQHVAIIRPSAEGMSDFLHKLILSPYFQDFIFGGQTGAGRGGLPKNRMDRIIVALPPLPEQQRIVARVDELMALLDRLETARLQREASRDRLATASLARLTGPAATTEDFAASARFALVALPALTTRSDQIKQLRQTILNLAVRGKLAEQDPNDEPVILPQSGRVNCPEPLPTTWHYTRLVHLLAENTRNGYSRRPDDADNGVPILRISAGTVRQDGIVAEEEHKLISGIDDATRIQYNLQRGDLLACRFNGNRAFVGRLTLFDDYLRLNPIYPDKLIRVRLDRRFALPEFIRLAGESELVRGNIEAFCATTVGNWGISASNLKEVPFPLPPLAEQHRIVAKVDALLALCDSLEAALNRVDTTRARLLNSLLHEALPPATETQQEAAE
ncbi:restriction endonuclease subunit S [uncultured Roseibium sp.]|uniref:restriction endonuclease subunit S n=1 Tax=uncultured Roseibium sp. TaxID=1936171 RepID=UPI0026372DF7|nr:restriction endonuclease subunit S [uncultured Roseibium sp.]